MGLWQKIILDDLFPCFPLDDPLFAFNKNGEYWTILIEKGFAKIHGSYLNLRSGCVKDALFDLTNCPTFEFSTSEEEMLIQKMN